jgi:hypothetical protein
LEPSVESVRLRATALLARIVDPTRAAERAAAILALRPQSGDPLRVFSAEIAEAMRQGYDALWEAPPPWRLRPDQNVLRVTSATVAELREGAGGARAFPGGYRDVVPHLTDGFVWSVWELTAPGASAGLAFDGLVAIDDRFVWFPKPWRLLPRRKPKISSHYAE